MTVEQRAEELFKKKALGYEMKSELEIYTDGFKDGYNKANEWHYVKDGDYPNSDTLVLFKTDVDCYVGKIDRSKKVWWTGFCRDDSISNHFVIAWKEIVLPEESE